MSHQPNGFGGSEPVDIEYALYHADPGPWPFDNRNASFAEMNRAARASLSEWDDAFENAIRGLIVSGNVPRTRWSERQARLDDNTRHLLEQQLCEIGRIHWELLQSKWAQAGYPDEMPLKWLRQVPGHTEHQQNCKEAFHAVRKACNLEAVEGDFKGWLTCGEFWPQAEYLGAMNLTDDASLTDFPSPFQNQDQILLHASASEQNADVWEYFNDGCNSLGLVVSLEHPRFNLTRDSLDADVVEKLFETEAEFYRRNRAAFCILNWKRPHFFAVFLLAHPSLCQCGDPPLEVSPLAMLREGYLSGVRLWIRRVVDSIPRCEDRSDRESLAKLCALTIERAKVSLNPETNHSLLGIDDENVCRLVFPLLFQQPVPECDTALWADVIRDLKLVAPKRWDADGELSSLGKRLLEIVAAEVARFGIAVPNSELEPESIDDAAQRIDTLIGRANWSEQAPNDVRVSDEPNPRAAAERDIDTDQQDALLWLFDVEAFDYDHRRSATTINEAVKPSVELDHFKRKLTQLRKAGLLEQPPNPKGRASGYWLSARGRDLAKRIKEAKPDR